LPRPEFDFLIVGQGLAGSLLALALRDRGRAVLVVDDGNPSAASRVAAGLVSPLTGPRLAPAADLDRVLPVARSRYPELEGALGRRFFHESPILRGLATEKERQALAKRQADPALAPYLGEVQGEGDAPVGVWLHGGGFLDTTAFLTACRERLVRDESFREGQVVPAELEVGEEGVRWQGYSAAGVVFCEGHRLRDNPWLGGLPLQPIKGEALAGQARTLPDHPVNRNGILMPLGGGAFRLGATYAPGVADEVPTAEGRERLLEKLNALVPEGADVEITAHRAGVRPASKDHRPLLGPAPAEPRVAVLNGLGAKGALLGPYYAACLADHLAYGTDLPPEAAIHRFGEDPCTPAPL
jgi:glycine/D-amino acid oxidase-like deaminating enzyme